MIRQRVESIFQEFENFPNKKSLVRKGQFNDAYEILAFEIILFPYHGIRNFTINEEKHRDLLEASIVPPPDEGVDIFFEEEDIDEPTFHVIQVKNSELDQKEIDICFTMMEKTLSTGLPPY